MKLVYLGTSGAMPTKSRGLSSTVLVLDKEYIMVDCGDGTGRQYETSDLKWNKPMTILVTHMHLDHIAGMLPLFQSMDLKGRTEPLTVYGVRGIKRYIEACNRSANFKFGFKFKVIEVTDKDSIITDSFSITMCKSKHQIPSLAYRITLPDKKGALDITKCIELGVPKNSPLLGYLKNGKDVFLDNGKLIVSSDVVGNPQKGLVLCFSGDTRPLDTLVEFFRDADFLTHESTFLEDELHLAKKAKHSTANEAGEVAKKANVKILILNHFSARHATTKGFYDEASKHHHNVKIAEDFMEVQLD